MVSFEVNDMSCGHCVGVITRAVQAIDPVAKLDIDLPTHRVRIDSDSGDVKVFEAAIREAGYTPVAA